jgi:hypothetical protein
VVIVVVFMPLMFFMRSVSVFLPRRRFMVLLRGSVVHVFMPRIVFPGVAYVFFMLMLRVVRVFLKLVLRVVRLVVPRAAMFSVFRVFILRMVFHSFHRPFIQ